MMTQNAQKKSPVSELYCATVYDVTAGISGEIEGDLGIKMSLKRQTIILIGGKKDFIRKIICT